MNDIKYYETRTDLLKLIPKNLNIAEIGVFKGEFAKEIIKICEPRNLYLVDIWSGRSGSGDKDGNNMVVIDNMEKIYLDLFHEYKHQNNVHLFRCTSVSFLLSCENDYFDAIYIDANHSFQSVLNDIILSYHKTKNNGIIMGHDYIGETREAIDEFCRKFNQKIIKIAQDGRPSFFIKIQK